MKAALTKDSSTSQSSRPFFNKNGEGGFFSPTIESEERPDTIQAKLTIGQPNDKYEQEADEMAETVSRMPMNNGIQKKYDNCGDEEKNRVSIQTNPIIQRTELEEEGPLQEKPLIQKDEALEEEDSLQTKSFLQKMGDGKTLPGEEEGLQTKPLMMKAENGRGISNPELSHKLNNTKGKGASLPDSTNRFMSQAFGRDFSNVQVHTDGEAVQMNQGLNARAFTHGSDIYFNRGEYNPSTNEGKKLLAHELMHVEQQGKRTGTIQAARRAPSSRSGVGYADFFTGKKQLIVEKNGYKKKCYAFSGTNSKDALPFGVYCVRRQGEAQRLCGRYKCMIGGKIFWYLLEPQFKTCRSRLHLHWGSRSSGCVTVPDQNCFNDISQILNKPGSSKGFGYNGCPPGAKKNHCPYWMTPLRSVDCVAFLKVLQ